ncbi:dipeptide/oligopeptide/nickel ABC transporter ATP-binding protein [Thalassospira sp. MA62]|nr:dipeptide/oligopeptide/nickel ABC transporter ATP-binding protein [Thalassospira sp. MA62]
MGKKGIGLIMIHIRHVSKKYKKKSLFVASTDVLAVDDVSLTIEQGTCFTLLGKSGSGKSTLGKLLLGIEKPDTGHIFFDGIDIHQATKIEKKKLQRSRQIVFQDCYNAVNPKFQIIEVIAEPLRVHEKMSRQEVEQRVIELLEVVGLSEEDMYKYSHQFSGGQLQRITIARAIAANPKLIVLDESVNSLDRLVQISILKLLKRLQQELGITYFFITHDLQVARLISDEIAVMHEGSIVERLFAHELNDAKHEATKALLRAQLKTDVIHPEQELGLQR